MKTINSQIPDSLYQQVEQLARRENISFDQLVAVALSAQVSAWMTKDYLEERARRGSWEKAMQVLNQVPDVEPEAHDTL
ncbi:MAG: hypothetical protein ABI977_16315 [Acidobacteriota bacterium]